MINLSSLIDNLGSIEQNDPELFNLLMQVYIDYNKNETIGKVK